MNSVKYISVSFLLLGSLTMSYGQQHSTTDSKESMVVMSEADIISLTSKLRIYKKEKALRKNAKIQLTKVKDTVLTSGKASNFELDYLRSKMAQLENRLNNQNNSNQNSNTTDLQSSELGNLRLEVRQLRLALLQQQSSNGKNNVVYLPPSNNIKPIVQPIVQPFLLPKEIVREQTSVNSVIVQQKLDSLYGVLDGFKQSENNNYTNNFDAIQLRIQELKNEMAKNKELPTTYENLVAKYKNYKQDIYFADNSKDLNSKSLQVVYDLYAILEVNENLDVLVKGFASNKGNAIYNENLSMQRTEAVKKALMLRGVHPTRVLTQYHGIDYSTQNNSKARRAEVSFLVRK
ncbi:OmpA family protein [Polaribacter sp. Q13]|uniref:OmpA family protein n=1 Tax=Polaribacter sp. Q13 TaxID=2806551 RepID=UPI00193B5007|nr:OmpA family protein [Polaribacter sp. Q13]QVY65329.1 OmpA family protein [Polaribacter sp. Q13]